MAASSPLACALPQVQAPMATPPLPVQALEVTYGDSLGPTGFHRLVSADGVGVDVNAAGSLRTYLWYKPWRGDGETLAPCLGTGTRTGDWDWDWDPDCDCGRLQWRRGRSAVVLLVLFSWFAAQSFGCVCFCFHGGSVCMGCCVHMGAWRGGVCGGRARAAA